MLWSAFKQEVEDLLGYEGDREAHSAFIDKQKRLAAIDLQRAMSAYRVGHTTVFDASGITLKGAAAICDMPEGAKPTGVWYDNVAAQPDAMVVEEAGLFAARGVYLRDGDLNLKPRYTLGEATDVDTIFWRDDTDIGLTIKRWILRNQNSNFIDTYSDITNQDVETPDLVEEWNASSSDEEPAPTLRRATWADIDAAGIDRSTVPLLADTEETPCEDLYSRKKLVWHPWGRRGELICDDNCLPRPGAFTYSRAELYAAPVKQEELDAGAKVILEWEGKKLNFEDADDTPFDESAVNAAHLYVTYKFLKHIDRVNDGWKVQQDYERERALMVADKNSE